MVDDDAVSPEVGGVDRRSLMKRAAVVGAATAWATPTVQSIAAPAFAAGSPEPRCSACITGGGQIVTTSGGTTVWYQGRPIPMLSFGLGQLCCEDWKTEQIQVNAHPTRRRSDVISWHFTVAVLACSKVGRPPSPPTSTADCANHFEGKATDGRGNVLHFVFQDHGEPGRMVDYVSIRVTDASGAEQLFGTGLLNRGNLQVHEGLGPIVRDCSGC